MHTVKSQILNIYFWNPFAYCLMKLWNQKAYMDNMFIVNICDLLKSANLQWNILIHILCSFEIRRPNEFFVYPFTFICQEYEKIIQFWKWIVICGWTPTWTSIAGLPLKTPKKNTILLSKYVRQCERQGSVEIDFNYYHWPSHPPFARQQIIRARDTKQCKG